MGNTMTDERSMTEPYRASNKTHLSIPPRIPSGLFRHGPLQREAFHVHEGIINDLEIRVGGMRQIVCPREPNGILPKLRVSVVGVSVEILEHVFLLIEKRAPCQTGRSSAQIYMP